MAKAKAKKPTKKKKTYGLSKESTAKKIEAPNLPYEPRRPKKYDPPIGLIGCGGITQSHLTAYRAMGFNVVALCDINEANAKKRRDEFYPKAEAYTDYQDVLERDDIEVVDAATHPETRIAIVEAALNAGKHVLSQKPFVLDLSDGERLADLADNKGLKIAVNQNGRWAPHFSYVRHAIAKGLIGDVFAAHLSVHWDHQWVAGTPFDEIHHLILYDFAIHWFDILNCIMQGRAAKRVFASRARAPIQRAKPDLLAQALIEYDGAQATLAFDAALTHGHQDRTFVAGTKGSLASIGAPLKDQKVTLTTKTGTCIPKLKGSWFPTGFAGTMGELLCAIEEHREPTNSARDNLRSLSVCFAAMRSADTGLPQTPGEVRNTNVLLEVPE